MMETAESSIMRVVIAKAIWTHIVLRYQSFHGGKKKITTLLVINSVNNRKQARANKHIDRPVQSYP